MSTEKSYIQPGYYTLTSYLYGKPDLVDFLRKVFEAEAERVGQPTPEGHFHAELKIGDSRILVGNGYFADPSMAAATWVYVPDVDTTYKRALKEGARSVREPSNQTWGDRVAGVKDPSGNTWWIATHKQA